MNELVSMAQSFSGLPMDSLIGGPLNAAAAANQGMALTQTKFMLDTCFISDKKDEKKTYTPIMIEMSLTRGVISPPDDKGDVKITPVTTTFNLPLLTIMPLNSLAVETVDITFEMEVKSAYGEEASTSKEEKSSVAIDFETKFSCHGFSASVKGNVSHSSVSKADASSHYDKSNSAKYTVNVHAGQLPLPKGVNVIIEAFAGAIQPITLPSNQKESKANS